jgi:hypothetical protein
MESDIGEDRGEFPGPGHVTLVVNTEGYAAAPQQFINLRRVPTFITEFDGVLVALWKNTEKLIQPLDIHFPLRRKLKQHLGPASDPAVLRVRRRVRLRLWHRAVS